MRTLLASFVILTACASKPLPALPAVDLGKIKIDHVYVKISSQDYRAIEKSDFFAGSKLYFTELNKTVSRWSGHYISGREGYLELFDRDAMAKLSQIGEQGFGLISETTGEIEKIHALFPPSEGSPFQEQKFELSKSPSSRNTYSWSAQSAIWVAEVDPTFAGVKGAVDRTRWMTYFRNKKSDKSVPLAGEILEVHSTLRPAQLAFFAQVLERLGFVKAEGSKFVKGAQSITFTQGDEERITRVRFSLAAPYTGKRRAETFGNVHVEVTPEGITWTFAKPK
ncbi:MAG TPA: DUF5829 family protein [Bdellovibrionota bacterium]|jgi:hypothetical protein|nr:DUF5829 family protein [Bdellovibrionota bacterium]